MAERAGFEPAVPCGTQHFQCCTIGHSVTSQFETELYLNAFALGFRQRSKFLVEAFFKLKKNHKYLTFPLPCSFGVCLSFKIG